MTAWLIAHGWRQLLGAAAMLGLVVAVLVWRQHDINAGKEACIAKQTADRAQIDALLAKLQAQPNSHVDAYNAIDIAMASTSEPALPSILSCPQVDAATVSAVNDAIHGKKK